MDTATVIVALPVADDKVNRLSSEEVAHLTLLYLGDVSLSAEAVLYVQHVCAELDPFGLSVEHRGTLGEDEADVLFFEDSTWNTKVVREFRHHLLLNDEIKRAYDSAEQFPQWTPHLTLGYPETPAKNEDLQVHYVTFDRVAVWTGDFEGPEFRLKYEDYADMEVSMSEMKATVNRGAEATNELLHYGVKGMKWGVRRKDRAAERTPEPVTVTQKKPGSYAKTSGGKNLPMSDDAKAALEGRQKAKASTTDSLSNAELRKVVERMNLEQQYSNLAFSSDRRSRGLKFVSGMLGMKRYGGKEKRRYKDFYEESGEMTRGTAAGIGNILKETTARA